MLRPTLPRALGILAIAGLATAPVAAAATPASGTISHSGIVTSVDPARGTLTLQEMGPWMGPATKPVDVSIALEPTTTVELVQRYFGPKDGGWPGGYLESPLKLADVHRGAFATVATRGDGTGLVAVSIDVVQPSNE